VPALRWIFPALAAIAALLLLPSTAIAAPGYIDQVKGIEYSATSTVGKFSCTATGPLPGAWNANVFHKQLQPEVAVPITGGSVTLYSRRTPRWLQPIVRPPESRGRAARTTTSSSAATAQNSSVAPPLDARSHETATWPYS